MNLFYNKGKAFFSLLIKNNVTKKIAKIYIVLIVCAAFALQSCFNNDDVGDKYITFSGALMGEYLRAHPERFSEFNRLLDTTKIMGLLDIYGQYTCFAPTNKALSDFYQKKGRTSISQFPYDSIVKIVYDHIIKGAAFSSSQFRNGRLPSLSMNNRYITTLRGTNGLGNPVIYINQTSPVLFEDSVQNGIVFTVDEALQPTSLRLAEVIETDKKFTMFANALSLTGLYDKLSPVEDKTYDGYPTFKPRKNNGFDVVRPSKRLYGFTALMESDSVFKANGINNLEDLKAYAKRVYDEVYPEDAGITDITNSRNSFNRFVAYHLIDKQLSYTKFIYDLDNTGVQDPNKTHQIQTYDMFEYLETMCPNTLMEVRTLRARNEGYGVFNMVDSAGDKAVRIIKSYSDKDALNGVYHEIDNILAYTYEFRSVLGTRRLRMDPASFFPELMNNNFRVPGKIVPLDIPDGYLARMTKSKNTIIHYLSADDRYDDYQGDEFWTIDCMYDIEVTTLPIPAGTYEVRFAYYINYARGVAQLYFDEKPCGIPLDLNLLATSPKIGYETPGSISSDPYGYENDKTMRNRGYMKGPSSFSAVDKVTFNYPELNSRLSSQAIRKILGIYRFDKDGTHKFRAKAAKGGQFMFDFMEFVPMEAIDKEGID